MAFIVTLKLLIDLPTAAEAEEFISNAIGVNSLADSEVSSPILDYSIEACEPVARCLSDSIVNETYSSGDAFRSMIIRNPKPDVAEGERFWSNQYGWSSYDLATRLSAIEQDLPEMAREGIPMLDTGPDCACAP